MGVKYRSGGVWVAAGTPSATGTGSTGSVPDAPTNVTATSNVSGQISVTWTAPVNVGGSAISNYIVSAQNWATGTVSTVTTSGSATAATLSGLAVGGTYSVSVQAVNSYGASAASSSVTVVVSGATVLYGPTGNEWPARTPTMSDSITATIALNDFAGLHNAIAANVNNPNPVVIALADGTWNFNGSGTNPIAAVSGVSARSQNMLIRPLHVGAVDTPGDIYTYCGGLTFAHFIGGFYLAGDANLAVANMVIKKDFQVKIGAVNGWEMVGCVAKNRATTDNDRMQIGSTSSAAKNGKMWRNWLEGKDVATTGHVDNMQVSGHTGYLQITNTYFGRSGNNATFFFKEDQQNGMPQPQITIDTVWLGYAAEGSNDFLVYLYGAGETLTFKNMICERNLKLRYPSTSTATSWDPTFVPTTTTNCRAQSYELLNAGGSVIATNMTPGVTLGTSTAPTFTPPSWWQSAWNTL